LIAEARNLRVKVAEAEELVQELKSSAEYRLGNMIIHARSVRNILRLPSDIWDLSKNQGRGAQNAQGRAGGATL
jgi:hypothetical protein